MAKYNVLIRRGDAICARFPECRDAWESLKRDPYVTFKLINEGLQFLQTYQRQQEEASLKNPYETEQYRNH